MNLRPASKLSFHCDETKEAAEFGWDPSRNQAVFYRFLLTGNELLLDSWHTLTIVN
jgi:hypothetical protein